MVVWFQRLRGWTIAVPSRWSRSSCPAFISSQHALIRLMVDLLRGIHGTSCWTSRLDTNSSHDKAYDAGDAPKSSWYAAGAELKCGEAIWKRQPLSRSAVMRCESGCPEWCPHRNRTLASIRVDPLVALGEFDPSSDLREHGSGISDG